MAGGFDGSLKFDTGINTDGFEDGISTLDRAVKNYTKSVENSGERISSSFSESSSGMVSLQNQIEETIQHMEQLDREYEELNTAPVTSPQMAKLEEKISSTQQKADVLKHSMEELAAQKIPTDEYKEISSFIFDCEKKLNTLIDRQKKLDELGVKKNSRQWRSLQYDIDQVTNSIRYAKGELADLESSGGAFVSGKDTEAYKEKASKLQELTDMLGEYKLQYNNASIEASKKREDRIAANREKYKDAASKLEVLNLRMNEHQKKSREVKTAVDDVGNSYKKAGKSSEEFGKKEAKSSKQGLVTILKYSLGIRSLYTLLNKLKTFAVDGFKNLSQYSKTTNKDLSAFKSSLTQLKNALAVAFAPIVSAATPYLTALINLLSRAANAVGRFFAALTGKKMATQAIKVQEDYAASLKKTGKAADETKGKLADFDTLSILDTSDKESSGGGGEINPSQMFEEIPINEKLLTYVDMLMAKLGPLKEAFSGLSGHIGEGLYWFRINVLEPFGNWTMNKLLPVFLDILTTCITILNGIITAFKPAWDYFWNEFLKPLAEWTGNAIIEALTWLNEKLAEFSTWITEHQEEVTEFITILLMFGTIALGMLATVKAMSLLAEGAKIVAGALFSPLGIIAALTAIVVWAGNGQEMIENLKLVFNGFLKFITGVFTGDWEKAWEGIKDIFKGVFNGIIVILESAVNFIAAGLNKISFDIPEWIPGIGGRHFGFSIPEAHLPRLATGTVVPPRAGEFAAILGDNNREPEIVSPISSMKQAFKDAIMEMGGLGSEKIVIEFSGSLAALGRLLAPIIRRENKRKGSSMTDGGSYE